MTHLNYEVTGPEGAPAIVLLHGFMSCNGQWLLNREALGAHYRLFLVELWGHGQSPLPAEESQVSVDGYVSELEAIREQHGIDAWVAIGQSYGAAVMIQYALEKPDRVTALVTTNSRSAFGATRVDAKASGKPAYDLRDPNLDVRRLPFHPIHARRFPPDVKAHLVRAADAMSPDAVRISGRLGSNLNAVARLHELQMPMLLTNGKFERAFQTDLAAMRDQGLSLRVAELDGGHSVNIEAAEGFNEAVLSFLADVCA